MPTDEPVPKMLRLILTADEWRTLRIMAAEQGTSMQAVVAATMKREIARKGRAQ